MNSTINERIKQVLTEKGITASEFASTIGVQASTVSHVLKDRNKPSQPFIEKLLGTYSDIDARWLLLGIGNMNVESEAEQLDLFNIDESENEPRPINKVKLDSEKPKEQPISVPTEPKKTQERRIVRIVTFYSDQTFDEFTPIS